jgi:hypothetical protein
VAVRHRRMHPAEPDWVPTLVVEVHSGKDGQAMVYSVATVAKSLNTDKRCCRVILVLGDVDAAFGLPSDGFRQTLVWIDDFTSDEANQFFDNVGCLSNLSVRDPPRSSLSPISSLVCRLRRSMSASMH